MSANTLTNRAPGQTILDTFFNDIHSALDGDFVGRGATGIPTSGQNLGTLALPWGALFCSSINLNGASIDTSKIVSPANRIVSGKKRTTSNQPAFLTPNGSAASVLIAGATTNLVLSIGGAAVAVNTDITKASLTVAPSTQNTATVNDATATAQLATRTWGEVGAPSKITVSSAGTNITALVGKFAAFKLVHAATAEYFLALVESTTVLSHALRGYFYDSSLAPINAQPISNGDTITLMNTAFVFMSSDAVTVDVSYTFPVYGSTAPSAPATGDYWYDTINQVWKRYDGATFQIINRTLIGMAIMDATNCVAARSFDFYAGASSENSFDLEIGTTTTNIQSTRMFQQASVNGLTIGFGHYLPVWNGTNNYTTSADYFSAFAASSTYYLYLTDQGAEKISDIPPYYRPDMYGYYNRHNPWRCIAVATTDASSNWSTVILIDDTNPVTSGMVLPFAGATSPNGWLMCDGSAVSRTTYAILYSRIGVTHGSGDGSTTFNVPDYRGLFLRGSTASIVGGSISAIASNQATVTGHGFNHTGVPLQITGTAPTGLSTGTTYYSIFVDANTIKFASTLANAFAGTAITISGAATGTVVQYQDPDASSRVGMSTGGNTSGIGSVQADQFGSHQHSMASVNYNTGGSQGGTFGATNGSTAFSSFAGGNETRPKNAYVNYIIKT